MIGGASMGSDASLGATVLDSHAIMAVAGSNYTIIAISSCYAYPLLFKPSYNGYG
jgi:hypothetical protein